MGYAHCEGCDQDIGPPNIRETVEGEIICQGCHRVNPLYDSQGELIEILEDFQTRLEQLENP